MKTKQRQLLQFMDTAVWGGAKGGEASLLGPQLSDRRSLGNMLVMRIRLKQIQAVEFRTALKRFLRAHADQGLTGFGEMVANIGSAAMINPVRGLAIAGFKLLGIVAIAFRFRSLGDLSGSILSISTRGVGSGLYFLNLRVANHQSLPRSQPRCENGLALVPDRHGNRNDEHNDAI